MRHTSGVPDYQDLLEAKGIELTDPAGQQEAIAVILTSQPDSRQRTASSARWDG
ncbi:hypothetical protein WEB32_34675 [Streptomyces netropsis]|uniref:ABC-type antimicrobial peptide transport system ATPase subunit n=1 Tax=Streptomyces netropsis TaxID=55404 RepID=A0A7W7LHW7_STRNE|nr:hypothetical protein [Streptomyces netropsis]MBB4890502.1 ABC-type antimicrobial peptide transport system ATPase subunit [Streptomyces netropsis]